MGAKIWHFLYGKIRTEKPTVRAYVLYGCPLSLLVPFVLSKDVDQNGLTVGYYLVLCITVFEPMCRNISLAIRIQVVYTKRKTTIISFHPFLKVARNEIIKKKITICSFSLPHLDDTFTAETNLKVIDCRLTFYRQPGSKIVFWTQAYAACFHTTIFTRDTTVRVLIYLIYSTQKPNSRMKFTANCHFLIRLSAWANIMIFWHIFFLSILSEHSEVYVMPITI